MKTFSIEDLRSIISDIRNSEEKKNLAYETNTFKRYH